MSTKYTSDKDMLGHQYIKATRDYCDYIEEHLNNVYRAFHEVAKACDGMDWVGDDYTYHTLRSEVMAHDLSKFSKEEFVPYRSNFFGTQELEEDNSFTLAWEHHKENNPHHWESIRYPETKEGTCGYGRTEMDLVHMIVDWTSMSYKFGGDAQSYYETNKDNIIIREEWLPFAYEVFNNIRKD